MFSELAGIEPSILDLDGSFDQADKIPDRFTIDNHVVIGV